MERKKADVEKWERNGGMLEIQENHKENEERKDRPKSTEMVITRDEG